MKYYIQDTLACVGNCALWWRPKSEGYTTQLEEAGEYEEEEALRIERSRGSDRAIPVEVAKHASVTHVRVERLDRAMAARADKRTHLSGAGKTKCGEDMRFRHSATSIAHVTCGECRGDE